MRLLRLLYTVRLRGRSIFRRSRVEQDLADEIRDHLERRIQEEQARGRSPEEARAAALRAFGGVAQSQEECRDQRRVSFIEHTIQDLRFAVRGFARTPAAMATILLLFALGIGFNTALFLLIRSFVGGPVPGIARQESLVRIRGIDRTVPGRALGREFSYPEYREYAAQRNLFRDVAAWTSSDAVLDVGDAGAGAEDLHSGAATYVTANYFPVLGVGPILGGGLPLDAADDSSTSDLVAVISHVLWERHFARAPDVIGRTMKVNGFPVTIVGVAPRRFAGARTGGSHLRVWLPLNARPQLQLVPSTLADYDDARYGLVARLQPGIRAEQANAAVQVIAARAAQNTTRGPSGAAASTDVVPLLGGNYFPPSGAGADRSAAPYLALLFPGLILLITCTNVSTLLAGIAVARRREIAVRLALGAARRRVVRQLVTESVLLAVAAAGLGLFTLWLLVQLFDAGIPNLEIEFDGYAIAFTFGLALLAGVLFGVSPALHATRLALAEALKDSAGAVIGRRLRLQSWLVVAQIAFTQPALLGMGALLLEMRSDLRGLAAQPFADRILTLSFNTNPRYGAMDQAREEALRRVQARLAAEPGVAGVVPQESSDGYFEIESHPADRLAGADLPSPLPVRAVAAPDGYFPLMGLSFLRGRDFEAAERMGDDVIVIGGAVARRLWGEADPVGRRLVTIGYGPPDERTLTVVGVVDEASGGDDAGLIFLPQVRTTGHLLVRTHGPAEPLLPAMRAAAAAAAPEHPVIAAQTLAAIEAAERRSIGVVIAAAGGAGGLALLLSAIGLYAVTAFAVRQRTREIGIRTALGAGSPQVVALFVRRGLRLGIVGLVIGLAISLSLGLAGLRLLSTVEGEAPLAGTAVVAALVAAVVIGVAGLASWLPARRAARIDPIEALRVE